MTEPATAAHPPTVVERYRRHLDSPYGQQLHDLAEIPILACELRELVTLAERRQTAEQPQDWSTAAVREVTQWFLAGREDGIPGDCVRASVASLLDLDPHDVPHFTCQDDTRVWPLAIAGFAAEHGWRISRRAYDGGALPKFGLAIGPSPRGVSHMVVVRDGEMVWDPHPSREGLVDVQQVIEFTRPATWPNEQQAADPMTAGQRQDGQLLACNSRLHPDFANGQDVRCELPDSHAWHRNGERTWTP